MDSLPPAHGAGETPTLVGTEPPDPATTAGAERTPSADSGLEARVRDVLTLTLELNIDPESDVIEPGVLDSLRFVQLLYELEREFSISVDLGAVDLDDFGSVRRIALYVEGELTQT